MSDLSSGEGVASAYDRWAVSYDADANRTRDLAAEVLRKTSLSLGGCDVVEIGCGTGGNTGWLAEPARRVLALDVSTGMLRRAIGRSLSPRAFFARHDLRAPWPVADSAVDAVVETLVLEHVEHLEPVFGEAARVLRPGGELFLCELHPMRQLDGKQARFQDPATGATVRVAAYLHDISQYVNTGLAAGFELVHLGEWRDRGSGPHDPPRLVSVHLRSRASTGAATRP